MFKTSVTTRVVSLAVLIALLLALFPTTSIAAKGGNRGVEAKWAKLVDTYNRQALIHNSAPRWAAQWLSDHPKASASQKAELQKNLAKSNNAWTPVPLLVTSHTGFDAQGNVVDKVAAQQSVKDLSQALRRYTASMKDLKAFFRLYQ